jgi:hypothetical protein
MKINPYLNLAIIVLFVTIFSFIIEFFCPSINNLRKANLIGLFLMRFIHFYVFLYFLLFLFLFDYKSNNGIIYLILAISLSFLWKILDCCIISYYEIKMYGLDHRRYLTTFHPCMYIYFRNYQEVALTIMGIVMLFTFYFITVKTKLISMPYKVFFALIFGYLFLDSAILSRFIKKNLDYPEYLK